MKKIRISWQAPALLLGAGMMFFLAGGDRPLELALWVAPLLLLRFFTVMKPGKAFGLAYPVTVVALFLASRGMMPLPPPIFAVFMAISGVWVLMPYLFTRLLAHRLPGWLQTLFFPVVMTAMDFLSSQGGWGTWGQSAYGVGNLALLQLASVTGVWGIQFLMAWTASVGNALWSRSGSRIMSRLTLTWASVMAVVLLFGVVRLHWPASTQNIQAAGVMVEAAQQQAFESALLPLVADSTVAPQAVGQIQALTPILLDSLLAKTARAARDSVDLVLWNEAAVPVFRADADSAIGRIRRQAVDSRVHIAATMAVIEDDLSHGLKRSVDNRILLITPSGEVVWQYTKSILVPGSEAYISLPGDSVIKAAVLPWGRVSGAICYEMDFPAHIRQASALKSGLFLAPANDWAAIKRTHAKMARLRAIENGTALFRVASRGVSQSVDPLGRVLGQWDYFEDEGLFRTPVRVGSMPTVYGLIGDGFAVLCVWAALALLGWAGVRAGLARWRGKRCG